MSVDKKAFDAEVGRKIREAREAKGMSQAAVGAALDVSAQNIAKYERGEQAMTLFFFRRLAPVLGLKVKDVLS